MKKNILKIALIALFPLFVACDEDRLDLTPEIGDVFTGDLKSEEEMGYAVNAIYSSLGSSSGFGADILIDGDLISDNVFVSTTNDGYHLTKSNMAWSGVSNPFSGEWRSLYTVVQRSNMVINERSLENTDKVKSLKGEAKISRGLAYFYLVQMFSANPTSGLNQEYGVPLVLELSPGGVDFTTKMDIARSTVDEVYAQIISDLEQGISEMSPTQRTSKTFLSPTAGRLILSKVYLTRGKAGDYEKAIQLAEEVLTSSPSNFKLIDKANYVTYFSSTDITKSEDQNETIFEIDQTIKNTLGVNSHLGAFYSNTGAHRSLLLRRTFFDTFETADIRTGLMSTAGAIVTDTPLGVWSKKWSRNTSQGNYTGNVKVFRMTEALFVKMEALAKLGRSAEATTLLNEFAVSRNATPYTSGDVLQNVLIEKRKEFFTEGHRFFDLKRNNLPINKETNCTTCDVSPADRLFVFPVDRVELGRNTLMTQYPGWDQ